METEVVDYPELTARQPQDLLVSGEVLSDADVVSRIQCAVKNAKEAGDCKKIFNQIEYGEGVSQGDISIQYLGSDPLPKLANGDVPQMGKRVHLKAGEQYLLEHADFKSHGIRSNEDLTLYESGIRSPLVGVFVRLDSPGDFVDFTHPEHANVEFHVPGWYVVRYQRALGLDPQRDMKQVD